MSDALRLLAVSIGNTRTSFGLFEGRELQSSRAVPNASAAALAEMIAAAARELDGAERAGIVVATVNPPLSESVVEELSGRVRHEVYEIGEDIVIPIERAVDPDANTGQDRLLAALAAFETVRQACVVVDAGTAVTVDFVDGVGVFQGGAIFPGASMMLRALRAGAAQLPEIELARPDDAETFGKNTREAMLNGVFYGIRGMVRLLVERYAERYGGYPQIVATGGDAHFLFDDDELVEHVADDLVLKGMAIACDVALSGAGEPPADAER